MTVEFKDLDLLKGLSLILPKWTEKNKTGVDISISCSLNDKGKNNDGISVSLSYLSDYKTNEEMEKLTKDVMDCFKDSEILLQLSLVNNYLEKLKSNYKDNDVISDFINNELEKNKTVLNIVLEKIKNIK